ncbi:hypothetical protein FACS189447_03290 [Spirochaetia bacterium]|nr:hypothetical protein FACS189447_03290 [Spirochaetia bacterium]
MARTSNNSSPAGDGLPPADPQGTGNPPEGITGANGNPEGSAPAGENGNEGGDPPPDPSTTEGAGAPPDPGAQEGSDPQGTGNPPPPVPEWKPGEKVRIKNLALKGEKIFLADGSIAAFDAEGVIEVDGVEAERLITIPGYEKA